MARLFGRDLRDLQDLFLSRSEGAGENAERRGPEPEKTALSPRADEAAILERIRAILAQKGVVSAGRLHIIGLDKARERVGPRWRKLSAKVHAVVRETFQLYQRTGDLFAEFGDTGYLVMFQGLSPQEAEVKCLLVAREVGRRLFGEEDAAGAVTVGGVVVGADGNVTLESADLAAAVSGLIDKEAARASEADAAAGGPVSGGLLFTSQPELVPARLPEDLSFVYRPFWDVRRKALSTYVCTPARHMPGRGRVLGYHVLEGEDLEALVPELDMLALETVKVRLADLIRESRKLLMACPVHVATFGQGRTATQYRTACMEIPEEHRRLLVFELWGLTPVIPRSRVVEVVLTLKAAARSVIADVPLTFKPFERFHNAGLHAVGTSVDIAAARRSEATIMGLMEKFVAGAGRAGLRTYAAGLNTLSLATAAVATGFDYVGGDAIHELIDSPEHVLRFDPEDLFSRLLQRGR
jgi:EAL domain-containing protein (putative c-di-GMP-specific phosphodiesterase class I)